jgi:hypothetical protein
MYTTTVMSAAMMAAFLVLCLAPGAQAADPRTFVHPGGLHSRKQIATARAAVAAGKEPWAAAYKALMEQADLNLKREPAPIANFNVPGYYRKPKVHRERSKRLHADVWAAYSCALAYQLTAGKERSRYADKAVEVLGAWARVNTRTSGGDGRLVMS